MLDRILSVAGGDSGANGDSSSNGNGDGDVSQRADGNTDTSDDDATVEDLLDDPSQWDELPHYAIHRLFELLSATARGVANLSLKVAILLAVFVVGGALTAPDAFAEFASFGGVHALVMLWASIVTFILFFKVVFKVLFSPITIVRWVVR